MATPTGPQQQDMTGAVGENPMPFVAPGPAPQTDIIEYKEGRGAEGLRPNKSQVIQTTREMDSLNALFGFKSDFGGQFFQFLEEGQIDLQAQQTGEKKLSPDEANKLYPNMPVPFSEPVYGTVAAYRAQQANKQAEQQAWISRGDPLDRFDSFRAHSAQMLDPANLAMGLVFGGANLVEKTAGNIAGNLVADVPTYYLRKHQQQQVDLGETLWQSVESGITGTLAVEGFGRGLKIALKGAAIAAEPVIRRMPEEFKARLLRSAVAQKEAGAKVDMAPATKVMESRATGAVMAGSASSDYRFTPAKHPSERLNYEATDPVTGESVRTSGEYGDGVYLVDKREVANNAAANPDGASSGKIHTTLVDPNSKFLDLDAPISEKASGEFVSAVASKLGIDLKAHPEMTLRDVLDQVSSAVKEGSAPESTMNDIQGIAKSLGYDGYKMTGNAVGDPHNATVVFDREKAVKNGELKPNKDTVPQMTPEQATAASNEVHSQERSEHFDPEVSKAIETIFSEKMTPESVDALQKNQEAVARQILDHETASEGLREEIQKIEDDHKEATRTRAWTKKLADCLIRGIT